MSLPGFLIIGAMKAGTTSLYRDLGNNPEVFLPADKEPGNLCHDEVLTQSGKRAYEKLFDKAKPNQLCGEASTAYSKLPDFSGVPQRAKQLLGENLKVIYLVRDPLARIISQHHHEISSGNINCNIDEAVEKYSRFINFSRYAMQIQPWIDALGRDNVLIIRFETYINNRKETVESASKFLDIEPYALGIDQEEIFNKTHGKPLTKGLIEKFRLTSLYRNVFRPRLSSVLRDKIRYVVLPRANQEPHNFSRKTLEFVTSQLLEDTSQLKDLMSLDADLWEINATS